MSLFRFNKIYHRLTADEAEVLELVFCKEQGESLLIFRFVDFFLVNALLKMSMGLFGEFSLDQVSNKAHELEVKALFQSRNMKETYIVLKSDVILKIFDEFHTAYGAVVPVVYYADKVLHDKAYSEWLREIDSCLPMEIIDFRFNGLPATTN